MKLSGDFEFKIILALVAVVAVGYVVYRAKDAAGDAAAAVARALNPFNNDNIINRGATSVYQAVTGSEGTIGTDIYDAGQVVKKRIDETNAAMADEGFSWPI